MYQDKNGNTLSWKNSRWIFFYLSERIVRSTSPYGHKGRWGPRLYPPRTLGSSSLSRTRNVPLEQRIFFFFSLLFVCTDSLNIYCTSICSRRLNFTYMSHNYTSTLHELILIKLSLFPFYFLHSFFFRWYFWVSNRR